MEQVCGSHFHLRWIIETSAGVRRHGWEEILLRRGIKVSEETEIARKKKRNGDGVRNG
jgi:hypothetical protein